MMTDTLAKWLKHPLHPVTVHIPLGAWLGALVLDVISQFDVGGNALVRLSFYAIALGLAVALLAVPTGVMDWAGVKKENPAWKLGLYHMALNLVVAVIFAINLGLRLETFQVESQVTLIPLIFSAAGGLLLVVSAYLGGLMVYHYGIGVARYSKERWRRVAEAGGAQLPPAKEK